MLFWANRMDRISLPYKIQGFFLQLTAKQITISALQSRVIAPICNHAVRLVDKYIQLSPGGK